MQKEGDGGEAMPVIPHMCPLIPKRILERGTLDMSEPLHGIWLEDIIEAMKEKAKETQINWMEEIHQEGGARTCLQWIERPRLSLRPQIVPLE